ncbi:ABC transporter ATP-binding protein [Roseisolibacter sp. H3M3-2]|uniref:ABC transporter ATP-binding protein n=1 Tax=Roseisolibacter sp. H3M3-2 TaxID=3031323 RepID=UPI0023DA8B09|nr:ABC transporter ATP-binding protein [Roseisolibacter sp. H3M3-2]MDF1504846.1 ABC transporter ATP-binding protein [Roseisolibacter sp. H3M3-2]
MHADLGDGACAVATHGLTKRYGDATALADVALRVPTGAVYLLVGANGAGKSTAFRALLNLERPDAGRAEVLGLDVSARGPEARAQVGYVPDRHDAGPRALTCGELLRYAAAYRPTWDAAYADRLARALALDPAKRVGALSKGNARRLQLLLALAHRPPVLLLDEPTDGLDPLVRRAVLALLAEHLADGPTTVLIATHHVAEVESLADHVGVLRGGRLVAQLDRDALHRTVRRYRVRLADGREAQRTMRGEARDVAAVLAAEGAEVREAAPLRLEDGALALLQEEVPA